QARVAADELNVGPGGAGELAAAAGLQLHIVDDGADRDALQRHGIARLDVRALAGDDLVARLQALRGQDIGLLAVLVADEGDEGGAVRVVLQALDRRRHVELAAPEVDDPVAALVSATAPAHGDATIVVATALGAQAMGQRLDRAALVQLRSVDDDQLALARRGRLEGFQRHTLRLPSSRRSSGPRPE